MGNADRNKSAKIGAGVGNMANAEDKMANAGFPRGIVPKESKIGDRNGHNLNGRVGIFVQNSVSRQVHLGTLYRFVNWACERLVSWKIVRPEAK
jgi:hypothetical protein